MDWPTDTLAGVYLFLFAFGALFSVASLLLGAGHNHLPFNGHGGHAAGGHGHLAQAPGGPAAHGHSAANAGQHTGQGLSDAGPSPVNISTLMIFLTWFGAAGFILRGYYGAGVGGSLLVAGLLGLIGASLVYLFLARLLWRGQTALDPADYLLPGVVGRISSPIQAGGTGEIVYILGGKRRVDGARSVDGAALPLGAEAVIVRFERGLAYVEPWRGQAASDPFSGQPIELLAHPPPGRETMP